MQYHATKQWYKTAVIIEIRHGGRVYLVKDDLGQQYVRGRRFLRLDDCAKSGHSYLQVNFHGLSPFSIFDMSENAQSDLLISPSSPSHSSPKCVSDTSFSDTSCSATSSNMHSPSDDPSSPNYIPQSRICPRGRKSTYIVNPVPTLVCGVPVDVVAIPHQYNHVPRGPLIPRSPPTHEGGEELQSDNESARRDRHPPPTHLQVIGGRGQHGDRVRRGGNSSQPGGGVAL